MDYIIPIMSYLVGAIPFGLLISKMAGRDVRREGSKNIGATNVSRILGKKLGLLTLVCDGLKGLLPMVLVSQLPAVEENRQLLVAATGLAAVVGHMFPIYLGFKGGKGVATALGVFLFLSPLAVLICLLVFVCSVAVTGFVSVGSLLASAIMPFSLWLLGIEPMFCVVATLIAALIWLRHHENIGRLLRGEEKSWKTRTK